MHREKLFTVTIDDCDVETFKAGGPGGQNQNKRDTGVRIKHWPSGAVGESREGRSQLENKRAAFHRMGQSSAFQTWAKVKALGLRPIEELVDEEMADGNLTVEFKQNGKWVSA